MSAAVILVAAIAPGIFWLWFFLRGRSYNPNPRRLIASTFFLGLLSTVPAAIMEAVLIQDAPDDFEFAAGAAASIMFLVVGPVEELSKFMAVRLGAFRSLHFDEPLDGLIFSTAASLGFATLENVFYAFQYGPEVMIARGPLSTLGHVVFGSFWGGALALRQRNPKLRYAPLAGLVVAAGAHGAFNFTVVTGYAWVSVLMVVAGGFWTARLFTWGQRVSPFRLRRNVPKLTCPHCGGSFRMGAQRCERCASPVASVQSPITCARCATVNRPDARFCTSCGDRFVRLSN